MYKVNIIGSGFVGLTLAEVLSRQNNIGKVIVIDTDEVKINNLKNGIIHVDEKDLTLKSEKISYSTDIRDSEGDIYFVCVGTPSVDGVQDPTYLVSALASITKHQPSATIIIKSTTLPAFVGFISDDISTNYPDARLITNPEFLAEGNSVADLMNQTNLIIGSDRKHASYAVELMTELFKGTFDGYKSVGLEEAMVIKYFLNSYKATKITFFNQFKDYCNSRSYSFAQVKDAVIEESVIGKGFDKPGVAYGGSCFPKDVAAIGQEIPLCFAVNELNNYAIDEFIANLPELTGKVLLVGKSFKLGTNDTRESVSVKVGDRLKDSCEVMYYDYLASLTDLSLGQIIDMKDEFQCVIVFDDYPEIHNIFKNHESVKYINTRVIN